MIYLIGIGEFFIMKAIDEGVVTIKVFVIGAHGKIGRQLISLLAQQGHQVFAGVRDVNQVEDTDGGKITPVEFNLTDYPEQMQTKLTGMDAVVFSAGAGGSSAENTILVDLDGAIKSMQATQAAGVKRYVIVSALYTDDRHKWMESTIQPYYAAKYYADQWLMNRTDLDYTIVRPGVLTDQAGSGRVQIDTDRDVAGKIARADVAAVLAEVVVSSHLNKTVFNVISGEKLIKNAINDL